MKIRNILILSACALILTAASLWIGQQAYSWLPPQGAAESRLFDELFSFLVTLGAFIFLGVTSTLMYSLVFHRAAKYDMSDGPDIEGNVPLEVVWTVIPVLLVIWIAGYSYKIYEQMGIQGPMEAVHVHMPMGIESAYAAPLKKDAKKTNAIAVEDIEVDAKQWAWVFRYPETGVTSTELHLPVNHRIRLAMRSQDVLHGFYIPAFRVKQDIIPQRKTDFEFTPIRPGKYSLTDSEFSGTYFATMQADVVVESPEDYKKWLAKAAMQKPSPAKNQAALEYAQALKEPVKAGWATVVPAQPPLVNYSDQ
jgi:cytochrome c oxidase subunit II